MSKLGDTLRDTFGVSGYREGVDEAKRVSWDYPRVGEIFSGVLVGAEQVMMPNLVYTLDTIPEEPSVKRQTAKILADVAVNVGVVWAVFTAQPEIVAGAVGAKVIYNAGMSNLHRGRSSQPPVVES